MTPRERAEEIAEEQLKAWPTDAPFGILRTAIKNDLMIPAIELALGTGTDIHASLAVMREALESLRPHKDHEDLCAANFDEGPCDCTFGTRHAAINRALDAHVGPALVEELAAAKRHADEYEGLAKSCARERDDAEANCERLGRELEEAKRHCEAFVAAGVAETRRADAAERREREWMAKHTEQFERAEGNYEGLEEALDRAIAAEKCVAKLEAALRETLIPLKALHLADGHNWSPMVREQFAKAEPMALAALAAPASPAIESAPEPMWTREKLHVGSTLDSFLEEQGIKEEVERRAASPATKEPCDWCGTVGEHDTRACGLPDAATGRPAMFVRVDLPMRLRNDAEAGVIVSICDVLDVISQGENESQAIEALSEAIELMAKLCHLRGLKIAARNDSLDTHTGEKK